MTLTHAHIIRHRGAIERVVLSEPEQPREPDHTSPGTYWTLLHDQGNGGLLLPAVRYQMSTAGGTGQDPDPPQLCWHLPAFHFRSSPCERGMANRRHGAENDSHLAGGSLGSAHTNDLVMYGRVIIDNDLVDFAGDGAPSRRRRYDYGDMGLPGAKRILPGHESIRLAIWPTATSTTRLPRYCRFCRTGQGDRSRIGETRIRQGWKLRGRNVARSRPRSRWPPRFGALANAP